MTTDWAYSTGTASVVGGGTAVTGDGTAWSFVPLRAGDLFHAQGLSVPIASVESDTAFTLAYGWPGDDLDGDTYFVIFAAPQARALATSTETRRQLNILDANGRGLFYNLIGVTGDNDPGPGNLALNSATPETVTQAYLDVLDANGGGGRDVSGLIDLWTASTLIIIRSISTAAYAAYRLTGDPVLTGGYRRLGLDYIDHAGTLGNEPIAIEYNRGGDNLRIDAAGPFADRGDYDDEADGFVYASTDGEDGEGLPSVLYRKNAASGSWSNAIPFQGPTGATGPAPGLTIGTTSNVEPGGDATASFTGTGPYALNLGLPEGEKGDAGWAIEPELVVDGESRTVIRVADWVGGEGAKPGGIGQYIGADGLTSNIAEAVNVQGNTGPTGPIGIVWAGAWDNATEYTPNMIVTDPDAAEAPAIWISLTTNTDSKPRDNATDWDFFPGSFAIPADYGFLGETPDTFTDYGSIA